MTAAQAQTATYGYAYCAACQLVEPIDGNWRALWVDQDGDLRIGGAGSFALCHERPDAVLACGEGTTLVLVERVLATGSFARIEMPPAAPFMVEKF